MDVVYVPPAGSPKAFEFRRKLLLSKVEAALAAKLSHLDGSFEIGCGALPDGIAGVRLKVNRISAALVEKPHLIRGRAVLAGAASSAPDSFRDRFGRLASMFPLPYDWAGDGDVFFASVKSSGDVSFEEKGEHLSGKLEIEWEVDPDQSDFGELADEESENIENESLRNRLAALGTAKVEEALSRYLNGSGAPFFRPGLLNIAETGGGIRATASALDLPRRARNFTFHIAMRSTLESDLCLRLDRLLSLSPLANTLLAFPDGSLDVISLTISGSAEMRTVYQYQRSFYEAGCTLNLLLSPDSTVLPEAAPDSEPVIPTIDPAELERTLTAFFGTALGIEASRGGLIPDGDGLGCRLHRIGCEQDGVSRSYDISLELRFRERKRLLEALKHLTAMLPALPPDLPEFSPPMHAMLLHHTDFGRQRDGGTYKHIGIVNLTVMM